MIKEVLWEFQELDDAFLVSVPILQDGAPYLTKSRQTLIFFRPSSRRSPVPQQATARQIFPSTDRRRLDGDHVQVLPGNGPKLR